YADRSAAMKAPEAVGSHFVLYFNESLRGLSAGAPVTLLGLPAGEVTDVGLDLDEKTLNIRGRVEIVTYPQRLVARLGRSQSTIGQTIQASAKQRQALLQHLVEQRSLRAQLRSGNLLTGQLFVALDYFPDSPKAKIDWNRDPTELPSVPSTLPNVEAKLSNIIAKLDNLPYDRIGSDVTTVLAGLNDTLKGASAALGRIDTDVTPELRTAIVELRSVMGTVDGMLKNQVNTTLGQLNTTLEELRVPLGTANTLLLNTDATLLSRNAPVQVELRETLQEVTRAARSLRVLMDYLERHPDSLIRGKTEEKP
ncbi:MAG TPA: MlaD family protein, partial [Candidatus Methylomirabilis sp.]|nr:MlaD family protein [Candidatus Methylomirabilis sp.]